MQQPTFFARRALTILVVIFFLVPFALRGARLALQGMKNDVKDWLPSEFEETKDLDEFRRYFLSEQFVLVSWEGCYGDPSDERFKLFLAKLMPETPPVPAAASANAPQVESADAAVPVSTTASDAVEATPSVPPPTRYIHRDENFIGDKLGLYFGGDWYENWGRRGEKWLKGVRIDSDRPNEECWYYLTPDGDLYRWNGVDSPIAALVRLVQRKLFHEPVQGTLVHSFGPDLGAWYYRDPRRLRAQLFKSVTTGPDVLASLTAEGGELSSSDDLKEEARRRLSGILFGPDGKTTCIVLTLTDSARRNLHLVCGRGLLGKPRGRLYEIAEESNIRESELRMGGPPVDNVAIDEEGTITLVRLVSYSAALGIGLSLLCFRSITATIMIFFVGGISAITSLALIWWCGSSVDAIMMSMPSLVYVLGLSGAAHIINYYHEAVDHHGYAGAPERAVAHGWKPAFLCNVTTAIGLITLVTSELVPIRKFGIFSALGVMAMLIVLLTYLPAALELWPQKRRRTTSDDTSWLGSSLAACWHRLGVWIIGHHGLVAIGCTLLIAAVGYGVVQMRTSVNLLKMFHKDAKIIQDYEWLETHLGQLVPMEVVVRIPKASQRPSNSELSRLQDELASEETSPARRAEIEKLLRETQFQLPLLERMELAARIQRLLEDEFGPGKRNVVGRAISAATFVRPLPAAGGSTFTYSQRAATSGRLEDHRDEFLHSDYLRITQEDGTELWRVSLRVGATKGVDYGAFVSDLQQTVEPVIAAQRYREEILRRIDAERRRRGEDGRTLASARVLLVGLPPALVAAAADQEPSLSDSSPPPGNEKNVPPVDQHAIFARTLVDLLTVSRLRLESPAAVQPAAASQYDCIVILGDDPLLAELANAGCPTVDARNHSYVPGKDRTAWQRNPTGIAAVYTGVVPIVYKAQRLLLDSLIQSTFWSVITITPLLMWIARSLAAGTVAMLPNVLPILMVFGGMGWLGIEVDVGSMMTASIALGVAVDDTIHYLNWFREELDRVGDRKKAILAAYQHCATPTVQAAIISGLGLSIFALSTFTPTQRFGTLMLVILWLGAIAELIYFPALLAGPLGLVFRPRKPMPSEALGAPQDNRPPQLQLLRGDDLAEEAADVFSDSDASGPPATRLKPQPFRHLRQDASHRRH